MQSARLCTYFATRRRGTVVQATLRLGAGVGVVVACLLVGGPAAAVAVADRGHGSHSGRDAKDDNKDNNDNRGPNSGSRGSSRGGSDWRDDNTNNDNGNASRSSIADS